MDRLACENLTTRFSMFSACAYHWEIHLNQHTVCSDLMVRMKEFCRVVFAPDPSCLIRSKDLPGISTCSTSKSTDDGCQHVHTLGGCSAATP